jgi:hypothetical protein
MMTNIAPLTDEELAELRALHMYDQFNMVYNRCAADWELWPCRTARLLAHITTLTTQLDDLEQCHRNDHARVADLLAEVERLRDDLRRLATHTLVCEAERDNLTAEVGELRELLARIEWGRTVGGGCPYCGTFRRDGHAVKCLLAIALAGVQE